LPFGGNITRMDGRIARRSTTDKAKPLCSHDVPVDEMIEEGIEAA